MWSSLLIPIFLIVLGMLLLFIEAIVPSFGIIGIAGMLLVGGGIFTIWSTAGMLWGIVAIGISVPLFIVALIFFFKSRASRIFVQEARIEGDSSDVPALKHLVGLQGVALTPLRPSGLALIDQQRHDVVSDGGAFVDKGETIVVVRIETNSIIVDRTAS
jgi:membrane-bound serine protease (ClpP class)